MSIKKLALVFRDKYFQSFKTLIITLHKKPFTVFGNQIYNRKFANSF